MKHATPRALSRRTFFQGAAGWTSCLWCQLRRHLLRQLRRQRWLWLGFAVSLLPWPATAAAVTVWTGVVTYVVDGDTVHVRPRGGGKPRKVRLAGVDAPEICQAGGAASHQALQNRLLGHVVTVTTQRQDDYGRDLARIELQQVDIAYWMVQAGHAWSYRSRRDPSPYVQPERQAQQAGRGIFAEAGAEYPGDFRRRHGSCHFGS